MSPDPPPEPIDLKRKVRATADNDPEAARRLLAGGEWLIDAVWDGWSHQLEALGADRHAVARAAAALQRELWLWLMGDRQWGEVAALLYGRVARHLPGPTSTNG